MGGESAVREQQTVAAVSAQRQHHAHHRVTHVVADGASTKSQAAENAGGPFQRPIDHPSCHFGHAGKAAIEFDVIQIGGHQAIQFQRFAQ